MADTKISALTELAAAPATDDLLALVDTSATTTKKLQISNLFASPTITTPTIGSFANANHNHTNSAGGGQLTQAALSDATATAGASKIVVSDGSGKVDTWVTDAVADGSTKGKAAFAASDFNASSGVISIDYVNGQKASESQAGFITELATAAETTTGTDATRAICPDQLAGSNYGIRVIGVQVFASGTNTATGDGKAFVRIPSVMNGWNLVAVAAHVYTAGTTNTLDIQLRRTRSGLDVDMLSTKITIDSTEVDTLTAATPAVINGSNDDVNTGDIVSIDVDAVHTTAAKGLFVEMQFQLP